MTNLKKDFHRAARSGKRAESEMKSFIKGLGFMYHTTVKELEEMDIDPHGTIFFKPPAAWPQLTPCNKQRKYIADGFIQLWLGCNCKGIIIEQKNSDRRGTTEEKVFYDLAKIRNGVYGTHHELWYVFTGTKANSYTVYKEFAIEAHNLPVKVIWGYQHLAQELKAIEHHWSPENQNKLKEMKALKRMKNQNNS